MRYITFITEGNRKFTALKTPRQRMKRLEVMQTVGKFKDVVSKMGMG
jgi:hypothetical protein